MDIHFVLLQFVGSFQKRDIFFSGKLGSLHGNEFHSVLCIISLNQIVKHCPQDFQKSTRSKWKAENYARRSELLSLATLFNQ